MPETILYIRNNEYDEINRLVVLFHRILVFLAAFEDFAKSMDGLCVELITKAENTAKELERTRYVLAITNDLQPMFCI